MHGDVMGFATGELLPLGDAVAYIRRRHPQPDGTADFDPLADTKRALRALAERDDAPAPSNGSLARTALTSFEIAEGILAEFPPEHKEAARRLLHVTRHAVLHEATAILRERGAKYAQRGNKQLKNLEIARQENKPWHTGDEELFSQIDALISDLPQAEKQPLRPRAALKKLRYSRFDNRPEKSWPSADRNELQATMKRYSRSRKKWDTYKTVPK